MSTQDKTKITIKPAKDGLNVPKPDGTKLNASGEAVVRNGYWVRRLNDGDVVLVESAQTNKSTTAAKAAANKGD